MFASFYAWIQYLNPNLIKAAFVAGGIEIKSINNDENADVPECLAKSLHIINKPDLTTGEEYYVFKCNWMNFLSHTAMQAMAKNSATKKCIINAKKAPSCTAYLFRKA